MALLPRVERLAGSVEHGDFDRSHTPGIIACAVICGVAVLNICALRLYARLAARRRLVADDWLFVVAACLFLGFDILFALSSKYGAGSKDSDPRMLSIISVINDSFYAACVVFLKLSMLVLYDAAFSSRNFRRCLVAIAGYTVTWAVISITITSIRCVPTRQIWLRDVAHGWCIDYNPFIVTMAGLNVVGHLAILVIPVPMVLRMSLSKRKQRMVVVSFTMGAATLATGVVRFVSSFNGLTRTGQGPDHLRFNIITAVELTLGLLCSCLPVYSYFFPGFNIPGPTSNSRRAFHPGDDSNFRPGDQVRISTRITGGQTLCPRRSGIAVYDDLSRTTHTNIGGAWVRVPNEEEAILVPMKAYRGSHRHQESGWTVDSRDSD